MMPMPNSSQARFERSPAKSPDLQPGGSAASWIYNAVWYPAFPLALIASGGGRTSQARRQRLGRIEWQPPDRRRMRIWLHAASVGEIEAVRPVALGLLEQQPDAVLVITTMTATGREAASRRIPGATACWLAPLDHPLTVRAFLAAVAPRLVVISEAELWPNYFIESRRAGARVALVNGRLSVRSLSRYRLMGSLWAAALSNVDRLLVQSQPDADRYLALGAPRGRIVVTGNTKFGSLEPANEGELDLALRRFAAAGATLIAGSTAPREEEQVLDAYLLLRQRFVDLRLVLAPRHLERLGDIQELLRGKGLSYVKATTLKAGAPDPGGVTILLLDTLGDLRLLYRYGTLAFVGGSLFEGRGGQNLGEPAAAGIAVLFGPFHSNQFQTAQALLDDGGGSVVRNAHEIACAAAHLLSDPRRLREEGAKARAVYQRLAGGAARSLEELRALVNSR